MGSFPSRSRANAKTRYIIKTSTDLDRTGEKMVANMEAGEREALARRVVKKNRFTAETCLNTRWWIYLVELTVKPSELPGPEKICRHTIQPRKNLKKEPFPVSGLTIITEDEDCALSRLGALFQASVFSRQAIFDWNEDEKDLKYFSSREEAVMTMNQTFSKLLPPAFNTWEEATTDEGLAKLCTAGLAQPFLRPYSSPPEGPESGICRAVPYGVVLECNLEGLGKYETRDRWVKYGAVVYLGGGKDLHELRVLAIYTCEHDHVFHPGDDGWSHAAAVFRCSLITEVTIKEHLVRLHWIIANGCMMAAREAVEPDSPLRRILKAHYYRTSTINSASLSVLAPIGLLGHRTFAFTDESWFQVIRDTFAAWNYEPWPKRLIRMGLSPELLQQLPVYQDGMLVWDCVWTYVCDFLALHFASDEEVREDANCVRFFAHFELQFDYPWKLPELTRDSLTELLTELIFNVTAGHELWGSIVEYLTDPGTCPPKLAPGKTEADVQSFALGLVNIALTGVRQPALMNDWTHLFEDCEGKVPGVVGVVKKFQTDLQACQDEIDRRNVVREKTDGQKKFVAFSPKLLECSVSI